MKGRMKDREPWRWLPDASAGRWIDWDKDRRSGPPWSTVSMWMPSAFPAYARVLPPLDVEEGRTRWGTLAAMLGVEMHPGVRGSDLLNMWDEQPLENFHSHDYQAGLSSYVWPPLREVLLRHTGSDWLILGFWDGHVSPEFKVSRELLEGPLSRRYALGEAHRSMEGFPQVSDRTGPYRPSLIWPRDRAWFLHSDMDDMDSKVGGSEDLIAEIFACPALEAIRVEYETGM